MPLLDKETALREVRQRFEAILEANLEEAEEAMEEEEEGADMHLSDFITEVSAELIAVVDDVFSRATPI